MADLGRFLQRQRIPFAVTEFFAIRNALNWHAQVLKPTFVNPADATLTDFRPAICVLRRKRKTKRGRWDWTLPRDVQPADWVRAS
jgi:hypothetical protein